MDVRDLDMEGVLVAWQRRNASADEVARIAARTDAGGPETARIGTMVGKPREEIAKEISSSLAALLQENGGEVLVDGEAAWRTVIRTTERIVSGDVRPGLGAMIIALLNSQAEAHWDEIRPFYGSWEQIHPDMHPSPELIEVIEARILRDARDLLQRYGQ